MARSERERGEKATSPALPAVPRTAPGLVWCAPHGGHHSSDRRSARPLAGRVCADSEGPRTGSQPGRARNLLRDVERALLLQVEPAVPLAPGHQMAAEPVGAWPE